MNQKELCLHELISITDRLITKIKETLELTGKNFLLIKNGIAYLDKDYSMDAIHILSRINQCVEDEMELCFKHANFLIQFCTDAHYIEDYWNLYNMSRIYSAWVNSFSSSEFAIHKLVEQTLNYVTEERFEIVKRTSDGKNIPDLWARDTTDGEIIPIEIKKEKFNKQAKKQLERYMITYHTSKGIAIGTEYTADESDSIIFMPISFFKKEEQEE